MGTQRRAIVVGLALVVVAACSDDESTGTPDPTLECQDLSDQVTGPPAADYYVTKDGSDELDGTSYETAFATVQRGIDALAPGQTLVIGPGEYFGAVRAEPLGSMDVDTLIRAEIPGTVLLRGDVVVSDFEPVADLDRVHVASFASDVPVQMVNELDTLKVLSRVPGVAELQFAPGRFFHDQAAQQLYLSSSDSQPASVHRYSASVVPTHGLYLDAPQRVVVEGLAATGFNNAVGVEYGQQTLWATYGMFIRNGRSSVFRNCQAYLNGRGIGTSNEYDPEAGENLVSHCAAWGNGGVGLDYDTGGLDMLYPHRDEISDSVSFLNSSNGVSIRGGSEGTNESEASFMRRCLSWGNSQYDYWIKRGENWDYIESSVATGKTGNTDHLRQSVTGSGSALGPDSIILSEEAELVLGEEFADPENFDFRLQATSRFVGANDGADRGAFPYEPSVFYLSPEGDDAADGLSIGQAWASLGRALGGLSAGDTLYLEPGVYDGDVVARLGGTAEAPIVVKGRGREPAVIGGAVRIEQSSHLRLERVHFAAEVVVAASEEVRFFNDVFLGAAKALTGINAVGLAVEQSTFTGFTSAAVSLPCVVGTHLAGNLYDNQAGPALEVVGDDAIRYSDYNSYASLEQAWLVGAAPGTAGPPPSGHDQASVELSPLFESGGGSVRLTNPEAFAAGGTVGRPIGHFRLEIPRPELRLLEGPVLHSVSSTTANIEWFTSHPAVTAVSWGGAALENQTTLDVNNFGTFSLTGLTPSTTYYFRIDGLSVPENVPIDADPVTIDSEVLELTTAAADAPPQTYYVSTDGDDASAGTSTSAAWRTIQHAADVVNVGDQVIVGGGTYQEKVRIRATGAEHAPITFSTAPGERVMLDGFEAALNQAFVVSKKSYLRFDGFYFANHDSSQAHSSAWEPHMGGQFNLYQSSHIEISRVLSDGRAYQDRLVVAKLVDDLHISNSVDNNKLEGHYFENCPNLLIENSVFLRPMIAAFVLRNAPDEPAVLRNNVYTDSLALKSDQNIALLIIDGSLDGVVVADSAFFLRSFGPDERHLTGDATAAELPTVFQNLVFVDPLFQGVVDLVEAGEDVGAFSPDRLMAEDVPFDFRTFFATEPALVGLGIGLDPTLFDANGVPN